MKIGTKVRLNKKGYFLVGEGSVGILQKLEIIDNIEMATVKWTNLVKTPRYNEEMGNIFLVKTNNLVILEVELPKLENERCSCCNRIKKNLVSIDNKPVCEKCYKELYTVCTDCGNLEKNENVVKQGEDIAICRKCLNDSYTVCTDCGEYVKNIDTKKNKKNKIFCKKCYQKKYFVCNRCNEEETIDKKVKINSSEVICKDCFDGFYFKCNDCGEIRAIGEVFKYKDGKYCQQCAPKYFAIKQYSWRPLQIKTQKERWDNLLYMGIELEVENAGGKNKAEQYASKFRDEFLEENKLESLVYMKHDGSIDGYEIVTHPFTLNTINKMKIREMLKYLKNTKHTSYESGKCGFHIHMNKDFFKTSDIKKMCAFFSANKEQLRQLSNRGEHSSEHFYQYVDYNMDMYFKNTYTSERHVALNTHTGKDTVEIRIFRGSLDENAIIGALQFADSLAHFVVSSGTSIMHMLQNKSWETYVEWLKFKPEYDVLKGLIKKRVNASVNEKTDKYKFAYTRPR